ncbi:MAG: hypothetical protein EOO46_04230 [Flavobacterium sp.]|nr:MAG: hypothetical protein EOO46_04230 [Flavobacterium sp.]
MITITIALLFLALYILYYTSKKATLFHNSAFEKWMQKKQQSTKIIGCALLVLGYGLLLIFKSILAATLLFFIALMTFCSLIIILKPLKKVNSAFLIATICIATILEFYYS